MTIIDTYLRVADDGERDDMRTAAIFAAQQAAHQAALLVLAEAARRVRTAFPTAAILDVELDPDFDDARAVYDTDGNVLWKRVEDATSYDEDGWDDTGDQPTVDLIADAVAICPTVLKPYSKASGLYHVDLTAPTPASPPAPALPPSESALDAQDIAHVLLDALSALNKTIDKGERPWHDYDGEPGDDPKLTESGYRALVARCIAASTRVLDEGSGTTSSHATGTEGAQR